MNHKAPNSTRSGLFSQQLKGGWRRFLVGSLLSLVLLGAESQAQVVTNAISPEDVRALLKRIEELEAKVRALETAQGASAGPSSTNKAALVATERPAPKVAGAFGSDARTNKTVHVSAGEKGFSIAASDSSFAISLKGLVQADSRTFLGDSGIVGNDTLTLRRLRPILQGTVYSNFDFLFVPEFGGSGSPQILDAYVNYRFRPELQFQMGKFKVPVGIELLQSDSYTFFSERGLPTALVPNRDVGFQVHGGFFEGRVNYQVGIFNGVGDARSSSNVDFDDNKSLAARLFVHPFKETASILKGLGFGVGGSWEDIQTNSATGLPATTGGALAGYATPVGQQFFAYNPAGGVVQASGEHWRISPQGYWYHGPLGLLGEYVVSNQEVHRTGANPETASVENTAWQIAAGWVITGEDVGFQGVVPSRPFNPAQGDWGALQLVARFGELNIDRHALSVFSNSATSARRAQEYGIGLNWWLNRNVRVNASYSHIEFLGGGGQGSSAPAAVTREDEDLFLTRVQLAF